MKHLVTLFAIIGILGVVSPSFAVTPEELKTLCENTAEKTDVSAAIAALREGETKVINGVTYKKEHGVVKVVIE